MRVLCPCVRYSYGRLCLARHSAASGQAQHGGSAHRQCIPLFDKAMGVCNLLAALAFALLGASFFILRSPVPALLVHILFLLAVLLVILLMAARTFLQQDHFY